MSSITCDTVNRRVSFTDPKLALLREEELSVSYQASHWFLRTNARLPGSHGNESKIIYRQHTVVSPPEQADLHNLATSALNLHCLRMDCLFS